MALYVLEEYYNMFAALIHANNYLRVASVNYKKVHPGGWGYPDYQVFCNLRTWLLTTDNLMPTPTMSRDTSTRSSLLIFAAFVDNHHLSTRVCSIRLGLSHHIVHKILQNCSLKPHRMRKVQGILTRDLNAKMQSANYTGIHRHILNYYMRILSCGESTFTPNGMFNPKNFVS